MWRESGQLSDPPGRCRLCASYVHGGRTTPCHTSASAMPVPAPGTQTAGNGPVGVVVSHPWQQLPLPRLVAQHTLEQQALARD